MPIYMVCNMPHLLPNYVFMSYKYMPFFTYIKSNINLHKKELSFLKKENGKKVISSKGLKS